MTTTTETDQDAYYRYQSQALQALETLKRAILAHGAQAASEAYSMVTQLDMRRMAREINKVSFE